MEERKIIVLLSIIAITTLSISTYQTITGYGKAFDSNLLAFAISFVLTSGMGIINVVIWQKRNDFSSTQNAISILMYMAFAFFSIVANFNSLYGNYMQDDWIESDYIFLQEELEKLHNQISILADKKYKITNKKKTVTQLRTSLDAEINNIGNKGFGDDAKKILTEIEKIIGTKLSIPNGSSRAVAKALDKQIDNAFLQGIAVQVKPLEKIQDEIKEYLDNFNYHLNSESKNPSPFLKNISNGYIRYNVFETKIEEIISDTTIFQHVNRDYFNRDIGNIQHTFQAAKKAKNKIAPFLFLMLCLLLDFMVPSLVFYIKSIYDYE